MEVRVALYCVAICLVLMQAAPCESFPKYHYIDIMHDMCICVYLICHVINVYVYRSVCLILIGPSLMAMSSPHRMTN